MKITKELLDNYLKGQCTHEECLVIEKYIVEHPETVDRLLPEEEWQEANGLDDYNNSEEVKNKIFEKLYIEHNKVYLKRKKLIAPLAIAASFLIGIGIFIFYKAENEPIPTADAIIQKHHSRSPSNNLYYINSGIDTIRLVASDSSVIWLYPQSEIKYAESFSGQSSRDLYLKGKAKFEVAKDRLKPFYVHSSGMTTTALGTIFIVDELQSNITQVKLLEGQIRVQTDGNQSISSPISLICRPNEEVVIDHTKLTILSETRHNGGTDSRGGSFQETEDRIIFKNLPLKDVVHILSQNYRIKIICQEKQLEHKYYSGTFKKEDKVYEKIRNEITYLHHVQLDISN